jgi:hypothetical protein
MIALGQKYSPRYHKFILENQSCIAGRQHFDEFVQLDWLGHMGHVREYTKIQVVEFLQAYGFRIESVIMRGNYKSRWKRWVTACHEGFKPFIMVVASKE